MFSTENQKVAALLTDRLRSAPGRPVVRISRFIVHKQQLGVFLLKMK